MIQQMLPFLQIIITEITEVKYTVANNSVHAAEPRKSTVGSASYDFFAAEEKTLFPHLVVPVTTEIQMEIPNGYFGKSYPRSGLLENYYVSCAGGVIESDFRGTILVLMTNFGERPILIKAGQRIAQVAFHKKEEVIFKKANRLNSTLRGVGGFGSTGI